MTQPYSPDEEWVEEVTRGWSKFDRVSATAAVLLGGAALAVAASLAAWDLVFPYVLVGVVAGCVAAIAAFLVRLVVFGRLPPSVNELLPIQVVRGTIYWLVVKFGIVCASLYLFVAAGIGLFLHWRVGFLVQGFVLLALFMMIGNFVQSCVVNASLVWQRRSARAPI